MEYYGSYAVFVTSPSGEKHMLNLHQEMPLHELRGVLAHLCDGELDAADVVGVYEEGTHIAYPLSALLASPTAVRDKNFMILIRGAWIEPAPNPPMDFSPLMRHESVPPYDEVTATDRLGEFSDDEIEYFADLLRLVQPNGGLLTADAFCRCFQTFMKHHPRGQEYVLPDDAGNRLFRHLDVLQHGLLSVEEVVRGLSGHQALRAVRQASQDEDEQWLRDIFVACDVSRTGMVSFEEMRRYLLSVFLVMRQQDPAVFREFGVSPDELAAATARQCFLEVDRDRDGMLTFQDFKAWYGAPSNRQFQHSVAKYSTPSLKTEPSAPLPPRVIDPAMLTELANLVPVALNRPDRLVHMFRIHAPNGLMSREGFHRLFQDIAEPTADSYRVRALSQSLFQFFDIDGNGVVDTKELVSGLTLLSSNKTDSAVRSAFAAYDVNGDGFVTKEEMCNYLTGMFRMMVGLDQTGSVRQVTRGASPESIARATTEQCFAEADINRDGKLSFEEFRRWYARMQNQAPSTIASDDVDLFPTQFLRPVY